MRFCIIIEEQYKNDAMPMVVVDQLLQWGHSVDVLEPNATITCLSDLTKQNYDAYVLKTVSDAGESFFLAQHYIENSGFDIKLYVMGKEVYSVAKKSPLHPDVEVDKQLIPITLELHQLALHVGTVFGSDIYGLDVVETPQG